MQMLNKFILCLSREYHKGCLLIWWLEGGYHKGWQLYIVKGEEGQIVS